MFLINFNQWKCACIGINNLVILLRARYKYNQKYKHTVHISIFQPSLSFFIDRLYRQLFNDAFQLNVLFRVAYFLNRQEWMWKARDKMIVVLW